MTPQNDQAHNIDITKNRNSQAINNKRVNRIEADRQWVLSTDRKLAESTDRQWSLPNDTNITQGTDRQRLQSTDRELNLNSDRKHHEIANTQFGQPGNDLAITQMTISKDSGFYSGLDAVETRPKYDDSMMKMEADIFQGKVGIRGKESQGISNFKNTIKPFRMQNMPTVPEIEMGG